MQYPSFVFRYTAASIPPQSQENFDGEETVKWQEDEARSIQPQQGAVLSHGTAAMSTIHTESNFI